MRGVIFLSTFLLLGPVSRREVTQAQEKSVSPVKQHQPTLVAQLGHSDQVTAVSLSGDGKWLVTGSRDNSARLWEAATGKEVRAFRGHSQEVISVSLSGDGKWLATGSFDNTARLWETATGKEVRAFRGHSAGVRSVSLSADVKWLATGSDDKSARLWEVATGKQIRAFQGHAKGVSCVALSGDGKWLATGSFDNTARLWEVATANEVRAFQGHSAPVNSVSFSGDGKWLATGSGSWLSKKHQDSDARLWEVATGKEVRVFRGHSGPVSSVSLSADGKWLATGGESVWSAKHQDSNARLWEVATGKEVRAFRGQSDAVSSVSLSADARWLATASSDNTARLWDMATGNEVRAFRGHSDTVNSVALSPDAKWLATGSDDKSARLWEVATGKEVRAFRGHSARVRAVSLSADGRRLVTASFDNTAGLWEAATGKEIRIFQGHAKEVTSVSLSADGKGLVTGSLDGTARLWEVATGKEVRAFRAPSEMFTCVSLSGDGKWLATGIWDSTARLWEVATGKEVHAYRGDDFFWVNSVSWSGDGKWLVTGNSDSTARLWEVATAKEIRVFRGHSNEVQSIALSADGSWLVTGSSDSTARLWEVASGKELCRLISFRDGTWAVIDPVGRFDAANGGDLEGLHWVAGMETIALQQLKERYYDPGLLAKYLGFNKEPLRQVAAFKDVKLFPTVEASSPDPASGKLTLKLGNQGGGIGKVQVFVNGRELNADVRGPQFDPDAATATLDVDLSGAVVKPGEKNDIRIVTWNAEGYLSSRGLKLDWEPAGRKQAQPMELYAIVAGVSTYSADHLKLNFPAKDAEDMATALVTGGQRLFGADKVHLTLLCDPGNPKTLLPTRVNFVKAFETARKARPTDVLVVYLAGHGIALQDKGQEIYCYLTREARTANRTAFADPAVREQSALTSAELTEWFKKIPALKQVLILDTCSAGAAASKLIEHRDVGADQIRAIDRLRDRTGFHVLMGCAADKVSYEASQYSQGVLTYSLLQGMRGAKLRLGEFVDVMDLFQYAADQVPLLARNIGGIQKPLVLATRATSFDIGQLKEEDKKRIPLALVRPLVLRPVLQNVDENVLDDDLKLVPLLSARFREESYAAARGRAQTAVFVDADDMPGAIRPSGKYTVEGKTVRVRLVLRRDGQTVASLQVEGTRDDLPGLVGRLMNAIAEKLKKL